MRFVTVSKSKVLVLVVAHNAERLIGQVLIRIPSSLGQCDAEILVIDDSSSDAVTFRELLLRRKAAIPFSVTLLFNPLNLGYGANQKLGFQYAIRNRFDFIAVAHDDGQYNPEHLAALLQPLIDGRADVVFGSRKMQKRHGLGNRVLTKVQNRLLGSSLTDFHPAYRLYSVQVLERIPFDLNADGFLFDTDIVIQLVRAGSRIAEVPISPHCANKVAHVDVIKSVWGVTKASLVGWAQNLGVFYERKYDVTRGRSPYESKLGFESSHTLAIERVPPDSRVLDIGCASGSVSRVLSLRGCRVTAIDKVRLEGESHLERFIQYDINDSPLPVDTMMFDRILLLDILEHLRSPEAFVEALRASRSGDRPTRIIVTSGNVGFVVTRLMLFLGSFNYGTRGILDLTHTRLFTFATLRRLFEQAGYKVDEVKGIPAPFPLAVGDNRLSRFLLMLNKLLIRVSKQLFAYQILLVVTPLPATEWLLGEAVKFSSIPQKTQ
jgi:glycosyltransferase involved in cell wall biosynthesis